MTATGILEGRFERFRGKGIPLWTPPAADAGIMIGMFPPCPVAIWIWNAAELGLVRLEDSGVDWVITTSSETCGAVLDTMMVPISEFGALASSDGWGVGCWLAAVVCGCGATCRATTFPFTVTGTIWGWVAGLEACGGVVTLASTTAAEVTAVSVTCVVFVSVSPLEVATATLVLGFSPAELWLAISEDAGTVTV